jgi:hypothetical protein
LLRDCLSLWAALTEAEAPAASADDFITGLKGWPCRLCPLRYGLPFSGNDDYLALAKRTGFACLFRHANRDLLRDWVAAQCGLCLIANAKNNITVTFTAAEFAGVSASADRDRSECAH